MMRTFSWYYKTGTASSSAGDSKNEEQRRGTPRQDIPELSLTQHLPNYQKLPPSATDATRTMVAFMYYALHKQLTGKAKSQQGCSEEFSCKTTPFKHLVTGKKQPGGPGRKGTLGKSSQTAEEVKWLESGAPPDKKPRCWRSSTKNKWGWVNSSKHCR